jgi:hypothetical protein
MFHAGMVKESRVIFAVALAASWDGPERLPLPFGRLIRMRRAWLVRILARLARTLGRFHRVRVVPLLCRELCGGLPLLDHVRDPLALPPDDVATGNRQG